MSGKLRQYQTVDDILKRHLLRLGARSATGKSLEQILEDAIRDTWDIAHDRGGFEMGMMLQHAHPLAEQAVAEIAAGYRQAGQEAGT